MEALSFLIVIATGTSVMCISVMLDRLWARVLPMRFMYYVIRVPGVVVHECSHVLGCLVTGAVITQVVFFSEEGGSVMYARPKIPVIGDVIISSAPLFCIPLVLTGLTWGFSAFLGCTFPAFPVSIGSAAALQDLGMSIVELFTQNLATSFHPWFLLYLYLTLSLVLSVAPSAQDIRNAAIGIALITVAGLLIFLSAIPWAVSILREITSVIGMGFALGLTFGLIALAVSLPPLVWYACTRPPVP